ncbi:hypothetical protein [Blastomonas sp.]|uniref:hypothetical protein n=1 Tax=Blastomonas sp. TaxID=1909299 RepID=UPI002613A8BD|nr:hypothetical protein [Blastomonas sp.]MDM7955143.1 hypothetical protein [Blastomonas sp.]
MNLANWARYGLAATLATAAGGVLMIRRPTHANHDAAPARSARHARRFGDYRVTGATVSIRATPEQILDCWQSDPQLWRDLEYLPIPEGNQPDLLLPSAELRAMASRPLLIRIVTRREGELIAWASEGDDHADMHGRMRLHDNGAKGIAVEVIMAVRPRDFASTLKTEAMMAEALKLGILRDLRRMKMLIETGEIATARMRPDAA